MAFSGGVDSTLLYHAAREALGKERVYLFHAHTELVSSSESEVVAQLVAEWTLPREHYLRMVLHPLIWPEFVKNSAERCYFCKKRMYGAFLVEADKRECEALLDGSNVDDLKSNRPGFRAIHELGVKSPLLENRLNKEEIRCLAKKNGLSNCSKPANSCLATRIPVGRSISREKLMLVDRCESFLLQRGFTGCRARVEGSDLVLQLLAADSKRLLAEEFRVEILYFAKDLGFTRVLLDMKGRL